VRRTVFCRVPLRATWVRAWVRPSPARYGESMPADGKDSSGKPVVLSRIYTRTGDGGTTALGDGSRVAKGDPRLAAYADVDEANCAIGTALALGGLDAGIVALLTRIQNELFDVGADLCNPVVTNPEYPPLRVHESYVADLERACDEHNEGLPTLRSFVLPGGTPGAALLHTARTVVRRAERSAWAALEAYPDSVNPVTARYLNRLSDLLFILARVANAGRGDVLWKPGGER
jgi:cob(I)alamin adenosyltransferase